MYGYGSLGSDVDSVVDFRKQIETKAGLKLPNHRHLAMYSSQTR